MARHRRRSVGPWVRRRTYLALWRRYVELERHYRVLAGDLDARLEDTLEEIELPPQRHVPSWAVTQEIPVVTTAGLDPEKADALVRRKGLLGDPAGSWR